MSIKIYCISIIMYYVVEYFCIVLFSIVIFFFTLILYNLIVTLCEGGFEPWRKGLSYMPLGGIKVLHVCYLWKKLHFTTINYTSNYTLYTKFLECTVCTSVFDRTSNLQFIVFNQQAGL